jgi:MFS transporter, DHA2 family, glioxin efflux transporter
MNLLIGVRTVFQTVGGAFSTSSAQAAFVNRLLINLPRTAPGVDPGLVIATGASELHNVFKSEQLSGVLEAYMFGIKAAFAVAVAFCGIAFLCSVAIPVKKLPSHATKDAGAAMG